VPFTLLVVQNAVPAAGGEVESKSLATNVTARGITNEARRLPAIAVRLEPGADEAGIVGIRRNLTLKGHMRLVINVERMRRTELRDIDSDAISTGSRLGDQRREGK